MVVVCGLTTARPSARLRGNRVTLLEQIIAAGGVGAAITGGFAWLNRRMDIKGMEQQQRLSEAEIKARQRIETDAELARQKLEYELKLLGHAPELLNQDMQRIAKLETTVNRLEEQVRTLQGRLEEEEGTNNQLRIELATMTRQYNDVTGRCEALIIENDNLRAANEKMSKTIKFDSNQLAQKVSDLEELIMSRAANGDGNG